MFCRLISLDHPTKVFKELRTKLAGDHRSTFDLCAAHTLANQYHQKPYLVPLSSNNNANNRDDDKAVVRWSLTKTTEDAIVESMLPTILMISAWMMNGTIQLFVVAQLSQYCPFIRS